MKKIGIVFAGIIVGLCIVKANAQTVQFAYDAAGNQMSRERIIDMSSNYAINEERLNVATYEAVLKDMKITIYPNPTKGIMKIDISGIKIPESASIRIYNLRGIVVSQVQNISESNLIDISSQPVGMYVMQIIIDKGHVSSWKIIKE